MDLTIVCETCGKTRTFRGKAWDMEAKLWNAGWIDGDSENNHSLPRGSRYGACKKCADSFDYGEE